MTRFLRRAPLLGFLASLLFATAAVGAETSPTIDWATIDYPGAVTTAAYGINERGDIVGRWIDADAGVHGYLLRHGWFSRLGCIRNCGRRRSIGNIVARRKPGCRQRDQLLRRSFAGMRRSARRSADRLHLRLDNRIAAGRIGGGSSGPLAGPINQRSRRVVLQVATQIFILQNPLGHALLSLIRGHHMVLSFFVYVVLFALWGEKNDIHEKSRSASVLKKRKPYQRQYSMP